MDPEKLAILAGSQSMQAFNGCQRSPQKPKGKRINARKQSPSVEAQGQN